MTFKIGDRVVAYRSWSIVKGRIVEIEDSIFHVEHDIGGGESSISFFHPKQCRKLKPKKRYEWWINLKAMEADQYLASTGPLYFDSWFMAEDGLYIRTTPPPSKEGWIRVREVKG